MPRGYSSSSSSSDDDIIFRCVKLSLPANVAACLNNRKLNRRIQHIDCRREVIDNVFSNYVIIKNILKYLPWQDKLVCKSVCSLWHSVVQTLSKEQLAPVDFSMNLKASARNRGFQLKKSGEFYNEPLAVFTYVVVVRTHSVSEFVSGKCQVLIPHPCDPPCIKEHCILDFIYQKSSAPKDCMFVTQTMNITYLPLPQSMTYSNAILRLMRPSGSYYAGVYIPKIPGVEFKVFNLKKNPHNLPQFVRDLKDMTNDFIIKGALVYLTDNYTLYVHQNDALIVNCLHHLGTIQPDIPFALGGCLVEDTMNSKNDINNLISTINTKREYISGNQVSLGLFVVPKNQEQKHNFDVYSAVIESTEWKKAEIHQAIREFSERIPRHEHSIAFKLSCNGRDMKHEIEQNYFRTLFPNTRLIGCFGNGELGVNYPPKCPKDKTKRIKTEIQYNRLHSYSTVFLYIGWGKVISQPECDTNN